MYPVPCCFDQGVRAAFPGILCPVACHKVVGSGGQLAPLQTWSCRAGSEIPRASRCTASFGSSHSWFPMFLHSSTTATFSDRVLFGGHIATPLEKLLKRDVNDILELHPVYPGVLID
jgi:hypothetical protein